MDSRLLDSLLGDCHVLGGSLFTERQKVAHGISANVN
jgi:hypothetical protein